MNNAAVIFPILLPAGGPLTNFATPTLATPDGEINGNRFNEGNSPYISSNHAGGANVAFCDGTVRFLQEGIDVSVLSSLISPAGARITSSGITPQAPLSEGGF